MRAAVLRTQGPPEALKVEPDYPKPTRKPGEVLVKVAAAAVNPIDVKTREGRQVPWLLVARPKVLGGDVAGVVEEADEGSGFEPGDRVFGQTGQQLFSVPYGTYAEWVSAPADTLLRVPDGFTLEQAAAVPLAAMTAWQAMESRMPLEGKSVLVHAGAGGVGHFAVQIAKAQGATVAATCGPASVEAVKGLGADRVVDYTKERFEEVAPGPYDVIVDLIGGEYEARGLPLLKQRAAGAPGGHYSNVMAHGWVTKYGSALLGLAATAYCALRGSVLSALGLGPSYAVVVVQPQASRGLQQIAELMREGKLKPLIDRVVPLEQVAEAHAHSQGGHARGKIVLKVADL